MYVSLQESEEYHFCWIEHLWVGSWIKDVVLEKWNMYRAEGNPYVLVEKLHKRGLHTKVPTCVLVGIIERLQKSGLKEPEIITCPIQDFHRIIRDQRPKPHDEETEPSVDSETDRVKKTSQQEAIIEKLQENFTLCQFDVAGAELRLFLEKIIYFQDAFWKLPFKFALDFYAKFLKQYQEFLDKWNMYITSPAVSEEMVKLARDTLSYLFCEMTERDEVSQEYVREAWDTLNGIKYNPHGEKMKFPELLALIEEKKELLG